MGEGRGPENARDQYLEVANCGRTRVYFIGPYGLRVSFVSQQRRALNTVWAMFEKGIVAEGARVAVVGASVAGIMAATALRSKKCNVWIFESEAEPFWLQAQASHRLLHPTVNFWPTESLDPTTAFPFFDWYTRPCASAIDAMIAEWEFFRGKMSETYFSTHVDDFVWNKDAKKVQVTWTAKVTKDNPAERTETTPFDAVIVATGFGIEATFEDPIQKSYWTPDELMRRIGTPAKYVIAGVGDGGLIDCLRLLHADFDDGRLALRFITALETTPNIRSRAAEIEKRALDEEPYSTDDGEQAAFYAAEYGALIQDVTVEIRGILDRSLRRHNEITLIGRQRTPFSSNAAPIHKLMLAHAMMDLPGRAPAVGFRQGEIGRPGRGDKRPFQFRTSKKDKWEALEVDRVIVRVGAKSPLEGLLKRGELTKLYNGQRRFGDFLHLYQPEDGYFPGIDSYPTRRPDSRAFIDKRWPLAQEFLRDFDLDVWPGDEGGLKTFVVTPAPTLAAAPPPMPYPRPGHLFGFPVVWNDPDEEGPQLATAPVRVVQGGQA